ncbi:MAG: DsbA family protein [Candidatus Magasanikbacteria bacterium]|jgi:protein-disulfide isomerase
MSNDNLGQPLRWYQRFSGIMLVGIAVAVVVFVLLIIGTTGYYYWQIRKGNGQILFNKIYSDFTPDVKNSNVIGKINRAELEIVSAPFLGSNNPKVTIVEFVDFKCPNSKAAAPIMRQVMQKYGNKVKLIIRNFPPSDEVHPGAGQLANLAMCAYEQGYYWSLETWLYEQQGSLRANLSSEEIDALAVQFGWDVNKMKTCLAGPNVKVTVNKDFADGYRFGVGGTPTFFINGEKVEGVIPFSAWELFLNNVK